MNNTNHLRTARWLQTFAVILERNHNCRRRDPRMTAVANKRTSDDRRRNNHV